MTTELLTNTKHQLTLLTTSTYKQVGLSNGELHQLESPRKSQFEENVGLK